MIDVSGSVQIDAPLEDVFGFMDVPENQAVITPSLADVSTIETLDNGGKRATYTYSMAGVTLEGEVRARTHELNDRIVFEMTGDIEGTIEWAFEDIADGTVVTYTATYEIPVPVLESVVEPFVRRYNERELETTLENLKTRLETGG